MFNIVESVTNEGVQAHAESVADDGMECAEDEIGGVRTRG